MTLTIYSDDEHEGKWFKNLSDDLSNSSIIKLKKRGENPDFIEKLLRYDRPDIILVNNNNPVLVLEQTSEVPTGHNIGQRFGRLVNAAEEGILTIFFLPFAAMKHGEYAGVCFIPARLFLALNRMSEIHKIPILAINWPVDTNHELIRDGSETQELSILLNEVIQNNFNFSKCNTIKRLTEIMDDQIRQLDPTTANPPPSVTTISTSDYMLNLKQKFSLDPNKFPNNFQNRTNTLIYNNEMTEANCNRTDPYTGQQFIYDYMECRNGPQTTDKHQNLVLEIPLVSKERWLEANPNDPKRKSALWYATVDLIELKDGIIIAGSKIGKKN